MDKCTICMKELSGLVCDNKWCEEIHVECSKCYKVLNQSDAYEYRGFIFCSQHFDEGQQKVEDKRNEVIEIVKSTTESQRKGEFRRNYKKYNINNVAGDGLPIIPIREPQILRDYEDRRL